MNEPQKENLNKKIWFKRRPYGWGWRPVSWQGWLTVFVYLLLIIIKFRYIDRNSHSNSDTLIGFAVPFIILTSILILICYQKGETPRWQWGNKTKDK
jgi:uncharacterized membrane protein YhaH (DUF805 family)